MNSWRTILEYFPDPMVVLDQEKCVVYSNPAFESVFGWPCDHIKGRPLDFIPPDQARAAECKHRQLIQEKVLHGFRVRCLTRSGNTVDVVMDAAMLYDGDQHPAGMVMVLRGNSRKRRKERVIHYLSHELKTPLAVLSASISLLARGPACSADPRWQRIHERIERNLQRLLDLEYKLEDLLRNGDDIDPGPTTTLRPDGRGSGQGRMEGDSG